MNFESYLKSHVSLPNPVSSSAWIHRCHTRSLYSRNNVNSLPVIMLPCLTSLPLLSFIRVSRLCTGIRCLVKLYIYIYHSCLQTTYTLITYNKARPRAHPNNNEYVGVLTKTTQTTLAVSRTLCANKRITEGCARSCSDDTQGGDLSLCNLFN